MRLLFNSYFSKTVVRYVPLCVALVVVILAALRLSDYGYGSDSAGMLEQIHTFLETGQYKTTHFPPGFGILAYPLYLVTENIPFSGVLLNYLCYLLILILTYSLSKSAGFSTFQSGFVVAVVALNPGVYTESNNGMSELVYAFLLVLVSFLTIKIITGEKWICKTILVGIVLSFTYLIRAEVLVVALLVVCIFLFLHIGVSIKRRLLQAVIVALMVVSTAFLYSSYLHSITGDIAVTGKTDDVFFNYGGQVDRLALLVFSVDLDIQSSNKVLDYIIKNPIVFLLRMIFNTMDLIATLLMSLWYVLIPFICGFIWSVAQPRNSLKQIVSDVLRVQRQHMMLIGVIALVVVLPVFSLVLFFIADRFVLPASVGASLILGLSTVYLLRRNERALIVLLVFSVLLSILNPYDFLRSNGMGITDIFHGRVFSLSNAHKNAQWSIPYRDSMNWVRINLTLDDDVVIAGSKKGGTMLAFLDPQKTKISNGKFIQLPENLTATVIVETLAQGVDLVVLNDNYVDQKLFRSFLVKEKTVGTKTEVCHADAEKGFIILALPGNCK